jgi:hypothetical protein
VQFSPGFTYADVGISVPEPVTLSLLVLGALATVALRRRSAITRSHTSPELPR